MQTYLDAGEEPPFPELSQYQHLLWQAFQEVGPAMISGFGDVPLTWGEVYAFAQASPQITEPWELSALVEMSKRYLEEKQKGKSPFCIMPMERG